ncbi:MAG: hypothetical protein ACTSWQ_09125 [Candidatus Thorarchaeota archaeon]
MGRMSEGAIAELTGHVREDQRLKKEIDEKSKERDEVRKSIEMILRAHNSFEEPIDELGLRVVLSQNRESRRMDYKTLMSEHESLYTILTEKGLLKISPPNKMYRLDVKKKKKS